MEHPGAVVLVDPSWAEKHEIPVEPAASMPETNCWSRATASCAVT